VTNGNRELKVLNCICAYVILCIYDSTLIRNCGLRFSRSLPGAVTNAGMCSPVKAQSCLSINTYKHRMQLAAILALYAKERSEIEEGSASQPGPRAGSAEEENGSSGDFRTEQSHGYHCGREALRFVRNLQVWKVVEPGYRVRPGSRLEVIVGSLRSEPSIRLSPRQFANLPDMISSSLRIYAGWPARSRSPRP
jgi:hypothetical protein